MEQWVDTILQKLGEIQNVRVVNGFPMTELTYPTIAVSKVGGEQIKRTTFFNQVNGIDTATIRNASAYSVLFQIDIFTKTSREKDQLMLQALKKLKELQTPSYDSPVVFIRAYSFRDEDNEQEYRGTMSVRFYCLDFEEEEAYLVKNVNSNISEVK